MAQDPKHHTLRLSNEAAAALKEATNRFGDSANSTLVAAIRLGLTAVLNKWNAPALHRATTRTVSLLTYNGNARRFRAGLPPLPHRK